MMYLILLVSAFPMALSFVDCRVWRERMFLLVLCEERAGTHKLCSGHCAVPTSPCGAMSNRIDEAVPDDGTSERPRKAQKREKRRLQKHAPSDIERPDTISGETIEIQHGRLQAEAAAADILARARADGAALRPRGGARQRARTARI